MKHWNWQATEAEVFAARAATWTGPIIRATEDRTEYDAAWEALRNARARRDSALANVATDNTGEYRAACDALRLAMDRARKAGVI